MLGNMLNDLAKAIRRWTEKKEFFPSVQCLRGFRQVVTQAFTCRKLNWNACKAISKRRLQKRAGEDLYIVHNAIPLTRASTNQQENKQNQKPQKAKHTKNNTAKNRTNKRAKGQQCALEVNSDSSLCAILRAGHLTSRRMQMTTSVPC